MATALAQTRRQVPSVPEPLRAPPTGWGREATLEQSPWSDRHRGPPRPCGGPQLWLGRILRCYLGAAIRFLLRLPRPTVPVSRSGSLCCCQTAKASRVWH
jgi:hypothetical protein